MGTQQRGGLLFCDMSFLLLDTQLSLVQVPLRPREAWEGAIWLHPIPEPKRASPYPPSPSLCSHVSPSA